MSKELSPKNSEKIGEVFVFNIWVQASFTILGLMTLKMISELSSNLRGGCVIIRGLSYIYTGICRGDITFPLVIFICV